MQRCAWTAFGHARLDDHARERFGRSGRWVRDLAALGEAAGVSPALLAALTGADGGRALGRVAAILIARAAAPDSIDDWIEFARRESVRDLRGALRRARASSDAANAGPPADDPQARVESGAAADPGRDDAPASTVAAPMSTDATDDPDDDRVLFSVPIPRPVMVAFDETLDLYRAVEGRDASVTSFVEALVGEAQAARPLDATSYVSPLLHGRDQARVEAALRRSTSAWETLPPPAPATGPAPVTGAAPATGPAPATGCAPAPAPGPAPALTPEDEAPATDPAGGMEAILAGIGRSMRRFGVIEMAAGHGDDADLDRQIRALIDLENDLEARLSALLAEMSERGMWATLMFGSVGHYAEERLGLSRSRTGERVRLTRALRGHPRLAAACASGQVSADAAAIIHRLIGDESVDADTEEAWVRHASEATVKRLRQEARAIGRYCARIDHSRIGHARNGHPHTHHPRTDHPPTNGDPDAHAPRPLDDSAWHASLRRESGTTMSRVLEMGWRAAGRPAARSGDVPEPDVFQLLPAEPDVFLRLRLPGDLAIDLVAAIESARADLERAAAASAWDEPWSVSDPTPAQFVARVEFIRGRRLPTWVGLLALLEDFARTWDHDAGAPDGRDEAIFVRDGWRCAAPGCTSRRHLEDHHIVYRSRGGGDGHGNRVTLCRFHHQRGEHGGLMSVRGAAPIGLTWRLGRPDVSVGYRNERRIDAP